MMRVDRLKNKIIEDIAQLMINEGWVLTGSAYKRLESVPVRYRTILDYFGRWEKLVRYIETSRPDMWEQIGKPQQPAAPKPKPQVKVAKPKAAAKKAAVKKGSIR